MNEKELNRYYYLKKEVEDLEERIETYDVGVSSVRVKELNVDSSPQFSSIQEKVVELKDKWMQKRVEALEEYIKIESFIDRVDDAEIRVLLRYRYLDLLSWEQIGEKVFMDRTSVSKKIRRFLNNK